ncbi:hypothetical protein EGT09_01820 [Pseudomonas putida]|uniref:hypothetical protein n=1 Tax=Pseudomonas putida TaxID=303 RepID=UPI000F7B6F2F|nr:hypothetical protein [Pseudomonas putida]RSC25210.1 hypothetical protein EGT09_01820 [Pseudomonas putida]
MRFLKRLFAAIAAFFSRQETETSEPLIPKIDPEKLKKKLDLQRIARENGAKGIPTQTATQLTHAEHAVLAELGRMREQTAKYGTQRLKQIQNRLDSIDITVDMNRMIELGNEFMRSSDHHLTREEGRMADFATDVKTKFQILTAFRKEHRLSDISAKTPSGAYIFLQLLIVIACCVAEGALNATFFGSGLEGGLLSGFTMAFGLSFINVFICFFCGIGFRYKNHVASSRRVCGWLLFSLASTVTLVLAVLISAVRHVLTLSDDGSQNPMPLAIHNIATGVFPVQDFESLILFCGTIMFGAVGVWKGYRLLDPYPGYASIWKQYAEAHHAYIELIDELRNKLEAEKADILQKIEQGVAGAEKEINAFRYNMNQKAIVKKQVAETLVMADETLQSLTRFYQNENMMARPSGSPAPEYFDHPVVFGELEMPDFDISRDEVKLGEQEGLLRKMVDQVEPMRGKIQASFNQQNIQLQPLQDLV